MGTFIRHTSKIGIFMKITTAIFLFFASVSTCFSECNLNNVYFSGGVTKNHRETYYFNLGCNEKGQCDSAKIVASSNENSEILFNTFYCSEKNKCESLGDPILIVAAKGSKYSSLRTSLLHSQRKLESDISKINLHGMHIYIDSKWSLKLEKESVPSSCYKIADQMKKPTIPSVAYVPAKDTPEMNPRFDKPNEVNVKNYKKP